MSGLPRTDWSRAARLTEVEFLACWDALELGEHPYQLRLRPRGITRPERDRDYGAALASLRKRRLADEHGPSEPLSSALRLLAAAPGEVDLRLRGASGRVLALGAMDGPRGVIVIQVAEQLSLLPISGYRVPPELVGLVGPLTPGPARPVNIAASVLDEANAEALAEAPEGRSTGLWTITDKMVRHGVARGDANSVARMCTGITATGQLGAGTRVEGVRRRGRWVVGLHRTRAGDFVQLRRPGGAHGDTLTIAPVDPERLLGHLETLIETLPTD